MLKTFRVKNFKSLREVTVQLDPVTVLIGRSGVGKSNFVEAIHFLSTYLVTKNAHAFRNEMIYCATSPYNRPRAFPQNADNIKSMMTEELRTAIQFDVEFDVPGDQTLYRYELSLGAPGSPFGEYNLLREVLVYGEKVIFSKQGNAWEVAPNLVLPVDANGLGLETVNGIQEVSVAHLILTAGIGCYDFDGDVLKRHQNSQQQQSEMGLNGDASNYLRVFEAINRNLKDFTAQKEIIAALRKLKPSLQGVHIAMPSRDKVIVAQDVGEGDKRSSLALDLNQESEGFRRFLAHLIALYQVPSKEVLVFEEPEKGMYPGALSALADQINEAPNSGRGQVILTTHSPQLLDHFAPEQLRVVEMVNFETKISKIANDHMESVRENLLTTGELLTTTEARSDVNGVGH